MYLINSFIKDEVEFIKKYKTHLLTTFLVVFVMSIFCYCFVRTLKPSERGINTLLFTFWKTSFTKKMQLVKTSVLLNVKGYKIYDNSNVIGHVYLEYHDELKDVMLVVNYGKNPKNAMICFINNDTSAKEIKRFIEVCKADFIRKKRRY